MTAKIVVPSATGPRMNPAQSLRADIGSALSGTVIHAATKIAAPAAKLNQNTSRQPPMPTRMPPKTGPSARARPEMAAHTPSARARAARCGYMCRMTESVPGSQAAAPTPMIAREAMSESTFGARAPSRDPATNTATPPSIIRLRPRRSPKVPAPSMRLANTRAYPLTTHCSCDTPACIVDWMSARATLTIVVSRNVRNRTALMVARARFRRPSIEAALTSLIAPRKPTR